MAHSADETVMRRDWFIHFVLRVEEVFAEVCELGGGVLVVQYQYVAVVRLGIENVRQQQNSSASFSRCIRCLPTCCFETLLQKRVCSDQAPFQVRERCVSGRDVCANDEVVERVNSWRILC